MHITYVGTSLSRFTVLYDFVKSEQETRRERKERAGGGQYDDCRPLCIAYGGVQAHGAADGGEDRMDLLTLVMGVQRTGNFRVNFGFEIGELLYIRHGRKKYLCGVRKGY